MHSQGNKQNKPKELQNLAAEFPTFLSSSGYKFTSQAQSPVLNPLWKWRLGTETFTKWLCPLWDQTAWGQPGNGSEITLLRTWHLLCVFVSCSCYCPLRRSHATSLEVVPQILHWQAWNFKEGLKGQRKPHSPRWVSGYNAGEGIIALGFHLPLRNHCAFLFLWFSLYEILLIFFNLYSVFYGPQVKSALWQLCQHCHSYCNLRRKI